MPLFDLLHQFLDDIVGDDQEEGDLRSDLGQRLVVATLLVHVARVDGLWLDVERRRLQLLLQSRFGLSERSAVRLLDRAEALDRQTREALDLTDRLDHDREQRRSILRMAYEIAMADGRIHEFEDDLVWRLGQLLGFGSDEIRRIRETVLVSHTPSS